MVSSASFADVTVPEPSSSLEPYSLLRVRRISMASGQVIVTSTTVTPPAIMAFTASCACLVLFARSTGISPTRSIISAVVSDISFSNLPCDARRAALHGALHFGTRRHAGVAGGRHGKRAVRHTAAYCPLHRLAREKSVDQP